MKSISTVFFFVLFLISFDINAQCGINDSDGDGIYDLCDLDNDNDGIPDTDELGTIISYDQWW